MKNSNGTIGIDPAIFRYVWGHRVAQLVEALRDPVPPDVTDENTIKHYCLVL